MGKRSLMFDCDRASSRRSALTVSIFSTGFKKKLSFNYHSFKLSLLVTPDFILALRVANTMDRVFLSP